MFNYWEPLHLLVHGHGARTWEYNPPFALRSWTYILLHWLQAGVWEGVQAPLLRALLPPALHPPKAAAFYLLRSSLAFFSSACTRPPPALNPNPSLRALPLGAERRRRAVRRAGSDHGLKS